MSSPTEAWLAVLQDEGGEEETEVLTLTGMTASPGATIESTDGQRITLLEPAGEQAA